MEELERGDNPNEKDMDCCLKAHDDLQTVLRVYESVLDGNESLPLKRTGEAGDEGGDAFSDGYEGGSMIDSNDDDDDDNNSLVRGKAGLRKRGAGSSTSSSRASPARGNLLDLEENEPLDAALSQGGESAVGSMLVAYNAGRFSANHSGTGGGTSINGNNFDSASSAALGSVSASNFASDTGAVYGSGADGGDSAAGFGETSFLAFFLPLSRFFLRSAKNAVS